MIIQSISWGTSLLESFECLMQLTFRWVEDRAEEKTFWVCRSYFLSSTETQKWKASKTRIPDEVPNPSMAALTSRESCIGVFFFPHALLRATLLEDPNPTLRAPLTTAEILSKLAQLLESDSEVPCPAPDKRKSLHNKVWGCDGVSLMLHKRIRSLHALNKPKFKL